VGKYLNRHYVSAFQKVATFQKIGPVKQGGNVASYFCTADGLVLHLIAGPVDGHTFLREARWANETYHLAQLENRTNVAQLRAFFRQAHRERLQNDHHVRVPVDQLPAEAVLSAHALGQLFDQNGQLNNAGKAHLLLTVAPLARIDQVYQSVFEKILNEKVSTNPVVVAR
jgi:hypothetical protein